MACPMCVMRTEIDDLKAERLAERVELGLCWVEGGLLNLKPTPTVISIDVPVSDEHRAELMALLKKIEYAHKQNATAKDRD